MDFLCFHSAEEPLPNEKPVKFILRFRKRNRGPEKTPCWRDINGNLIPLKTPCVLQNAQDEVLTQDGAIKAACVICAANGYRFGLVDDGYAMPEVNWDLVHQHSYETGYSIAKQQSYFGDTGYDPIKDLNSVYKFVIPKGQVREAYHALIAVVLMPFKCVVVQPGEEGKETYAPETAELLKFYSIPSKFSQGTDASKMNPSGKDESTHIISRYFQTYEEKIVFETIRRVLEKLPHDSNHSKEKFAQYATQSHMGKYWLNRYLSVTEQRPKAAHPGRLPKFEEVDRMAILVIRRDPKTTAGRVMTKSNLDACLNSIEMANEIGRANGQSTFTHIMLYGDIQAPEAQGYAAKYAAKNPAEYAKKGIELLYISKPWKPSDSETKADGTKKLFTTTQEFWAEFRGEDKLPDGSEAFFKKLGEGAPLQVRVLSFFLTLQARYRSKLCYIGFRSGFLDGAALLGSPVFYIDDSMWQTLKKKNQSPLSTFYRKTTTVADPTTMREPRMVEAGNAIGTFIRIDVERKGDSVQLDSPHGSLVVALHMYMLAPNPDSNGAPYWEKRSQMLKDQAGNNKLETQFNLSKEKVNNSGVKLKN